MDTRHVLDFPWEVLDYLNWLRERPAATDPGESYLFDEPRVRFTPNELDVLVLEPGASIELRRGQLRLESPRAPSGLPLTDFTATDRPALQRLLRDIDGGRTLAEIRQRAGASHELYNRFIELVFGRFLFAPLALLEAERAVSGVEITRFPGSPYEIARAYWQNMGTVRTHSVDLPSALDSNERFLRCLRHLHVLALMGEDLQTYYQPQSPISRRRAAPGRLMTTPSVVVQGREECVFVSGPRVRAALVGGAEYHAALYDSLNDTAALAPRNAVDADGVDWGRVVRAQAKGDAAAEDWFCPPRPIGPLHIAALRGALRRAHQALERGARAGCIEALADFHQAFVRLHPFHCGNQSLAMNIVNGVLGQLLGAGVPHLMLDHLALRLTPAAYARAFRRCTDVYVSASTPLAARYLGLASMRARAFDFTGRISAAAGSGAVRELIAADPDSARLLLLLD